ncbi:peptidoglycan editing factor PgeF [Bacillus fonticola]|uniref:peptidoglycan editing factor PgeF n=1 Tax=Bacillus fonticola TaxID=2728853 RepID=UPI0014755684|nr:peptidoglycan editing factor PgeF [Bacillus fonticola]
MDVFKQVSRTHFDISPWTTAFPSLLAGVTNRAQQYGFHVGDDPVHVKQHRTRLAQELDVPLSHWVSTEQTHETNVREVTRREAGCGSDSLHSALTATDGLITNKSGVLLTLLFADCVPLYFFDPKTKWIGVSHAGWRGTVGNIAGNSVRKLTNQGASLSSLEVVIGPSICGECYIVDDKVISRVDEVMEHGGQTFYNEVTSGQYALDLRKVNKQLLIQADVAPERIRVTDYCTSCHNDQFFSHRKEQGQAGRILAYIGWKV